jgi:hypothetical protein
MVIECKGDFVVLLLDQIPQFDISLVVCKAGLFRDFVGTSQYLLHNRSNVTGFSSRNSFQSRSGKSHTANSHPGEKWH